MHRKITVFHNAIELQYWATCLFTLAMSLINSTGIDSNHYCLCVSCIWSQDTPFLSPSWPALPPSAAMVALSLQWDTRIRLLQLPLATPLDNTAVQSVQPYVSWNMHIHVHSTNLSMKSQVCKGFGQLCSNLFTTSSEYLQFEPIVW